MNFIEILLLLAFLFFPLLQALLEKLGKERGELPPPPEVPEEEITLQRAPTAPAPARAEAPTTTQEQGWSTGWGSWPTEEAEVDELEESIYALEALTAEEVVSEGQADELLAYQERLAAREIPEATRVSVPVVSMESLQVDRRAEHRRLHDRFAPAAALSVTAPPSPAAPLRRTLRRPEALREAILLNEVLGPPRALQPPPLA